MLKNFRGPTMECLRHYASTLPKSDRARGEAKKPLAAFTGASPHTVGSWLSGKQQPPVGEFLVKARYFLEANGYKVAELDRLAPDVQEFGRMIAHGVIEVDRAVRVLEIPSRSYLFRILRGGIGPSSAWAAKMSDLVHQHRDALQRQLRMSVASLSRPQSAVVAAQRPDSEVTNRVLILQALANHVTATIPLAERIVSDDFTPGERQQLHELAGQYSVFRLSNLLNRLCSEKAREIIPDRNAGSHKPEARRRS